MTTDNKLTEEALRYHSEERPGKIGIVPTKPHRTQYDLSLAYSPGVAVPSRIIAQTPEKIYDYTGKGNLVAVVSNGTAVLGLGNIGPLAAKPVMEGKCMLFKTFAGIDAFDIEVAETDPDAFVRAVRAIAPTFGGINLEDIKAPECFEIEARLRDELDIPVMHDDQHGTAIITSAGLLNACKVTGKKMGNLKIVISGAGSAGISIAKMVMRLGFGEVILCGSKGTIYDGAPYNNPEQQKMAQITNRKKLVGSLADAMKGADILIGVSKPGIVTQDMIRSMAEDPIVFVMSNPVPEIMPDLAKAAGAAVVGTGRSDFPNQVNNVIAFPGIFRGALDGRARKITEEMKEAAARAIASVIPEEELTADYVLPDPFNPLIVEKIAAAVMAEAAKEKEAE